MQISQDEKETIINNFDSFLECIEEPLGTLIKKWLKDHEVEFLKKRNKKLEDEKTNNGNNIIIIEKYIEKYPKPQPISPWANPQVPWYYNEIVIC